MENLIRMWRQMGFREKELKAFEAVDRKIFVLPGLEEYAYEDHPLPLIRGKTISQPSTMMIMTSALELEEKDKVFEVGTGSGYQAAIIARIARKGRVISTEVIPELLQYSRLALKKAGIGNVSVFEMDGSLGMPEEAPFDKVIITAAAKEFPKELVDQLKTEGIIVGPIGDVETQQMVRGIKRKDGGLDLAFLGEFLFTPMYGKYGFEI